MVKLKINQQQEKLRFLLVGGINTLIDFGILFSLTGFGLPKIPSNMIATGVAFCFSFFANRKFTFKASNQNVNRQIFLFLVITLFGLWVIQPIIISLTDFILQTNYNLLIGKLLATVATLIWNYTLYSRVVFNENTKTKVGK